MALYRTLPLIALLVAATPLAAQEEIPEFLTRFETYQESLTEPATFGFYIGGSQNMGRAVFQFSPAPEGSGAIYLATSLGEFQFGPDHSRFENKVLLDGRLQIVTGKSKEDETENGVERNESHSIRRENGNWAIERTIDGEEKSVLFPHDGPAHPDFISMILFARAIDLVEGTTHDFRILDWDNDDEGPQYISVKMSVTGPESYSFRGREVTAHGVRYEQSDEETFLFRITPEREILAIEIEGTPVSLIAGTEEEISKNIEGVGGDEGAGDSPKATVAVYFRIHSKEAPVAALDGIMDWDAIHAEMAAEYDDAPSMTPKVFAGHFKVQFENQPAVVSKEQVDAILALLTIEIDGNDAKVTLPEQEEDPFLLEKGEDGWKITHFPH
jgi:hypothetical protein